jgi:hypothetical protein
MEVELWPIEWVKPYEYDPRQNDGAVDAVAASIRESGFASRSSLTKTA